MELSELTQVMKMLDKIITSNRPEIKDAFRELLVISTLAEQGDNLEGPLVSLMHEVRQMRKELDSLRIEVQSQRNQNAYNTHNYTRGYPYTSAGTTTTYNPTTTSGSAPDVKWLANSGIKLTAPSFLDLGDI